MDPAAALDAALAAIGGFEPRPSLAVGVSGGPDSLALTILADRWARERGGTAWALTVDHRLRPESAAEAERVGRWLAARNIPHATLVWRDAKPSTGIQEAAREARYRLLAEWCAEHGCLHLLLAHHRDDQAETYLIRRRAASGADGLAGMATVREVPGLRLVRPLLAVPKARLLALLDAERQPYVTDPSNRDPVFERARLRLGPGPRGREGEGPGSLAAEIRANAANRIAREREVGSLLAAAVALHPAGFAVLDAAPVAAAGELGERALDRLVAVIGGAGARYPLRRERLARLRQALGETPFRPRTLGGCRFVSWRGRVLALRETARAAAPLSIAPGGSTLWDRRFLATLSLAAERPVRIAPLGSNGAAVVGRNRPRDDNPLPRFIYPTLPAFWDDAGVLAVPHLLWARTTTGCRASLAFRPPVSLFGAGFTVV